MSGTKNKIRGLIRKWQSFAHPERAYSPMESSNMMRKTRSSTWEKAEAAMRIEEAVESRDQYSQSETSSAASNSLDDVPEGFLAVYVGKEKRRFVIGTHFLNHTLFRGLVETSATGEAEDSSSCAAGNVDGQAGAELHIACEVVLFEHLLWLLGNDESCASRQMEVDELLDFYKY